MHEKYLEHFDLTISDDIRKFVDDTLKDKEYLFVRNEYECEPLTREKIKVQYGHCSHCKKEYRTEYELKHNETVICEECGAELKVKEIRYGKKVLRNDFCFYWFDKSLIDPSIVTCKGYYLIKNYDRDYKNPDCDYNLCALYIFDTNKKESRMFKDDWYSKKLIKRSSIFDFNINSLTNKECYYSFESLDKAVKDTIFQYSDYKSRYGFSMVKYLDRFCKYPWIEQLQKMGLNTIANELLDGNTLLNSINYRGKDIFKKLKLNRGEVKQLTNEGIKSKLSPGDLRMYQINRDNGFKCSFTEAHNFFESIKYRCWNEAKILLKLAGIKKILKYSSKQLDIDEESYYDKGSVINKWIDYIKNCEKLEWNVKDKSILFPKELVKAHNHTTSLINAEKNKEVDKKIKKRLPKLKKKYFFKDNTFFIRPAENSEDLINEGGTLNHCVAIHYMQPYAEATTDILMIRRIDNPTVPLVTVEVKNGEIRQAYGKNDTVPKKDVQGFIEKFKSEVLENIKNSKKKNKKVKVA